MPKWPPTLPGPITEFAYGVPIQLAADTMALGGRLASLRLASKRRENSPLRQEAFSAPLRNRVREQALGHCTALGVFDSPEYISYRRREDGPVLRGFLQMENPQRTTKVKLLKLGGAGVDIQAKAARTLKTSSK